MNCNFIVSRGGEFSFFHDGPIGLAVCSHVRKSLGRHTLVCTLNIAYCLLFVRPWRKEENFILIGQSQEQWLQ